MTAFSTKSVNRCSLGLLRSALANVQTIHRNCIITHSKSSTLSVMDCIRIVAIALETEMFLNCRIPSSTLPLLLVSLRGIRWKVWLIESNSISLVQTVHELMKDREFSLFKQLSESCAVAGKPVIKTGSISKVSRSNGAIIIVLATGHSNRYRRPAGNIALLSWLRRGGASMEQIFSQFSLSFLE